jgi:hypothetical protein
VKQSFTWNALFFSLIENSVMRVTSVDNKQQLFYLLWKPERRRRGKRNSSHAYYTCMWLTFKFKPHLLPLNNITKPADSWEPLVWVIYASESTGVCVWHVCMTIS